MTVSSLRDATVMPHAHERDVAADVLAQQLVGLEQVVFVVLLEHADPPRLGERSEVHGRRIHRRRDVHEAQVEGAARNLDRAHVANEREIRVVDGQARARSDRPAWTCPNLRSEARRQPRQGCDGSRRPRQRPRGPARSARNGRSSDAPWYRAAVLASSARDRSASMLGTSAREKLAGESQVSSFQLPVQSCARGARHAACAMRRTCPERPSLVARPLNLELGTELELLLLLPGLAGV